MKTITFFTLIFGFIFAFSQTTSVEEGTFAFMTKGQETAPGVSAVIKGKPEYVSIALQEKFKVATQEEPQRVKKAKDLYEYESIVMNEISDASLNYYYKVEPVKGKEDQSQVYFFLSPGNNNFWTSEKYRQEISNTKNMLNNMDKEVKIAEMNAKIAVQSAMIKEMTSEDTKLGKEKEKLEKERVQLEKALEKNQEAMQELLSEQESHAGKLAEQKLKLTNMEKERSSIKK